ncbi:hypothetical protein EC9_07080 [Rosistilla ulvae]|uniref:Uncharacterized protein n=1 Tax=Rosistilla ulvae TaxID=1930277 RepID=A0A517LV99_9BACT|nr:hypothetical protein EC9_07080 [Rosistilla ulvae]
MQSPNGAALHPIGPMCRRDDPLGFCRRWAVSKPRALPWADITMPPLGRRTTDFGESNGRISHVSSPRTWQSNHATFPQAQLGRSHASPGQRPGKTRPNNPVRRPNGPAPRQPRATPWENEANKTMQSPNGAALHPTGTACRRTAPLGLCGRWAVSKPRALPWADITMPPLGRQTTDFGCIQRAYFPRFVTAHVAIESRHISTGPTGPVPRQPGATPRENKANQPDPQAQRAGPTSAQGNALGERVQQTRSTGPTGRLHVSPGQRPGKTRPTNPVHRPNGPVPRQPRATPRENFRRSDLQVSIPLEIFAPTFLEHRLLLRRQGVFVGAVAAVLAFNPVLQLWLQLAVEIAEVQLFVDVA